MKSRRAFKRAAVKLFRAIQKILLTIFLVLIYIFGFGFTFVLAVLFNRKTIFSGRKNKDSSWLRAQGYRPDLKDCFRQS
ncbi:MAG: hypothetical protein WC937_00310 [Candidatus Omnitrophota bacterium]|nr:hypothetical protein [Candidatus Omnitrophota bacterium]MDD5518997.1 hypothetical protein [Candidatus Omnitrophota bacterium]